MEKKRHIKVLAYDPNWPAMYTAEAKQIRSLFDHDEVCIEHIGSTSVPELYAKPVIDILLGADSLAIYHQALPKFMQLGYHYMPKLENGFPDRRFFKKRDEHDAGFHIHAVVKDSDFWQRHIKFRDILRKDKNAAEAYAALKQNLAEQFPYDIANYVQGKTKLIEQLLNSEG